MKDFEFIIYLLLYAIASIVTCVSFTISTSLGILIIGVILGTLGLDKEDVQQCI